MTFSPRHHHVSDRRVRLANQLLRASDAAVEGARVVAEHAGGLGVVLGGVLRDVWLFLSETDPAEELYPGGSAGRMGAVQAVHPPPELLGPLAILALLPEQHDQTRIEYALASIVRWAERHDAPATMLAFAEALALLTAADPQLALTVARLARDHADYLRAELWYREVARLASHRRDRDSYVRALAGRAVLSRKIGNHRAAISIGERALRAARVHRVHHLIGRIHHHLYIFAADLEDLTLAYEHARAALAAYGPGHPCLPALANDLACFWCDQGWFARSEPVFAAALAVTTDPAERAIVAANLARAAAGAGHTDTYRAADATAQVELAAAADHSRSAEVFGTLARAAGNNGDWAEAVRYGELAVNVAQSRGDAYALLVVEADLAAARAQQGVVARVETPGVGRQADRLASDLLASLHPG